MQTSLQGRDEQEPVGEGQIVAEDPSFLDGLCLSLGQSCILQAEHRSRKRFGRHGFPTREPELRHAHLFAAVLEFYAVGFGRGDQRLEFGFGRDYASEVFGIGNCCLNNQSRKDSGQPASLTSCSKFASNFNAIVAGLPTLL